MDREGANKALVAAAAKAFRGTRFYADTFETEPGEASRIPFLTDSDYFRASGLDDCVVDREAITGILPPYDRDASRFPFTAPEDHAELVLRQQRIVRAMEHLGVDFATVPRFLIVTDALRGPFACELAKGFYWEGFQSSILFGCGSGDELRREIDCHRPDYVVLTSQFELRHALDRPPETVWLVEHCGTAPLDDLHFPALLYADGIDLIGSRAFGESEYDHDDEQLLIEENPDSRFSHLSKLKFTCFPLIRYGLGRRVPTLAWDERNELS